MRPQKTIMGQSMTTGIAMFSMATILSGVAVTVFVISAIAYGYDSNANYVLLSKVFVLTFFLKMVFQNVNIGIRPDT
jgi:hypothetical protein